LARIAAPKKVAHKIARDQLNFLFNVILVTAKLLSSCSGERSLAAGE
jgi:hypothetical protein